MTHAAFAKVAGVSRATMSSWRAREDSPRFQEPSKVTLLRMAERLEAHAGEAAKVAAEMRARATDASTSTIPDQRGDFAVTPIHLPFRPPSRYVTYSEPPEYGFEEVERANSIVQAAVDDLREMRIGAKGKRRKRNA
jgi:hypothetical protein